ncbi:MAG: hypothetical protein MHPDNHAH_03460 [Anaerolineales bacterium]|nr:hypothetical protein [Anaerolineales bacterium]
MVTRELIHSEVDRLNADKLDEVYEHIRQLNRGKRKLKKKGVLSKIRRVKISGPKDFSVNHDLYISGKNRA